MWTTNSPGWDDRGAHLQCVVCRYSQDGGPQDPSIEPAEAVMILLVTREVVQDNIPEAYQVLSHVETAGHSSTAGPHTKFTEFRVPNHNLLAPPGKGAEIVVQCFTATATLVGAMSVGIMAAAFEAALAFSKSDSRGGAEPILSRQSVSDLLMNVKMRTDAARFLTWKACHALENGLGGELALEAKIYCSDSAVRAVTDAMSAVGMYVCSFGPPIAPFWLMSLGHPTTKKAFSLNCSMMQFVYHYSTAGTLVFGGGLWRG
jgi:alkylation response protein AidB-like acyl-CoA dehydrogenase